LPVSFSSTSFTTPISITRCPDDSSGPVVSIETTTCHNGYSFYLQQLIAKDFIVTPVADKNMSSDYRLKDGSPP